ncbi:MAG: oligosaccharide flippase family protein [Bacteroidota bacterium]
MSQIKKLAGQTAIYGLSSIIGRLLNYLLVPLYTRIFEPEAYGVVSEFYAYVTFLIVLYTYGMETAYFHFSNKHDDQHKIYSNSFSTLVLSSVLLSSVLILFSNWIAGGLGYSDHPEYIVWFALILAFDAITALPFAKLRQENKAKKFALIKIVNISTNIGLNLFFLAFLPHLTTNNFINVIYNPAIGVGYVFIANLLSSFITLLFFYNDFKLFRWKVDMHLVKEMLVYAFPLLIAGFAGMINETLDRAILKYLVTDKSTALHQLGIYSACYKLSIIMTLFVQTYRYAAEPFFFSQQKKKNSKDLYANIMNYFVFICSLIFLGVMLYMNIAKNFIGEKFHEGLKVVPILLFANLFLGVYLNLSMWYKLSGQTKYGAWFSIFGATITIVLNFLLIPTMGYLGAAWATFICYGAMMLISYLYGQKYYPIPYDIKLCLLLIITSVGLWQLNDFVIFHYSMGFLLSNITKLVLLFMFILFSWRLLKPSSTLKLNEEL